MKHLENIDMVKVASIAGSILTVAATLLSTYAKDAKTDQMINDKVAKAIEEELSKRQNG